MSKLVLVVDDSSVIRKMVSTALTGLGFAVTTAANGAEALAIAVASPFNVVITDLNMPVMNGLEFMIELRKQSAYRFTPFVFLTTDTNTETQDQARKAGATAWLQKPFQPLKVGELVNRLCP